MHSITILFTVDHFETTQDRENDVDFIHCKVMATNPTCTFAMPTIYWKQMHSYSKSVHLSIFPMSLTQAPKTTERGKNKINKKKSQTNILWTTALDNGKEKKHRFAVTHWPILCSWQLSLAAFLYPSIELKIFIHEFVWLAPPHWHVFALPINKWPRIKTYVWRQTLKQDV